MCSLCFSESWLNDDIADSCVEIAGFTTVRVDKDARTCGKNKGGGLILYVNNRWCNPGHITVKEMICCQGVELLVVGLRPYYVPREFSHMAAIVVYIDRRDTFALIARYYSCSDTETNREARFIVPLFKCGMCFNIYKIAI